MAPKKGAKLLVASIDKVVNPLFEKRPKQFGIGRALPPKKDLHRFVRWQQVVRIQCKKMILKQRLKVPPLIHQLSKTLDKNLGLLSLTSGPGDKAQEILEESVSCISEALRVQPETSKISSLLECLAIITFIGGEKPEQTDKSMQIMWHAVHPKLGANVAAAKPSPAVITMVISAWSFLLPTIGGREINAKSWQESISYLSTLLDKDDRQLRNAAGEALALILETGSLEKFCG